VLPLLQLPGSVLLHCFCAAARASPDAALFCHQLLLLLLQLAGLLLRLLGEQLVAAALLARHVSACQHNTVVRQKVQC
jgi:hypothetical protein